MAESGKTNQYFNISIIALKIAIKYYSSTIKKLHYCINVFKIFSHIFLGSKLSPA